MSICEIFPDDPTCAVEVAPVEETVVAPVEDEEAVVEEDEDAGMEGEEGEEMTEAEEKGDKAAYAWNAVLKWTMVKDMTTFSGLSPAMANLGMAGGAAMFGGWSALQAFRYQSKTDYYKIGEIGGDTNWWKLASQVGNFGNMAVGGILALTSLMAAAGIAVGVNGLAWMYLGIGEMFISAVVGMLFFLGYDGAYGHSDGTDVAKKAAGASMMGVIKSAALIQTLHSAMFTMTMWGNFEALFFGLWNAKTDEEQATSIEMWEESIATKAMAVEEARAAMGPAAEEKKEDDKDAEEGEDAKEGEDAEEGAEDAEEGAEEATEE